jgi:hypothetical protein
LNTPFEVQRGKHVGLPWIPLHTNLPTHPKSIALGLALKDKRAWTYMVQAWVWAADHAQDGRLSARNGASLIEYAAGWEGEQGAFVAAAIEAGFIDRTEDGSYVFHDWDEMNAGHVAKKERDAARQRERRARLSLVFGGRSADAGVTSADASVTEGGRAATVAGEIDTDTDTEDDDVISDDAPHPDSEGLRAVWNAEKAPEMPEWRPSKSRKRRQVVNARLKERPDLSEWRAIVQRLARSDFARGLVPARDGRRWLATPTFLLRPESGDRVLEGLYDNRSARPEVSDEPQLKRLY